MMLEPIMNVLGGQKIILASSSPRRQEMLKNLKMGGYGELAGASHSAQRIPHFGCTTADAAEGVTNTIRHNLPSTCPTLLLECGGCPHQGLIFRVVPSKFEENLNPGDFPSPEEFVMATAAKKVAEVRDRLREEGEEFDVIIGADTVVCKDRRVHGKPKDEEEAFRVLKSFSGSCHTVFSGVCVRTDRKSITFSESTDVYFGDIPDDVLKAYVKTGDPMDKAGGYGIQMRGGTFIRRIEGDYYNVVGLPLYSLCKHLYDMYSDS